MRVETISVKGLWSFGAEGISLENLGQHNVVIGKNNVGKSKILAAIRWVAATEKHALMGVAGRSLSFAPDVLHDPGGDEPAPHPHLTVTLRAAGAERRTMFESFAPKMKQDTVATKVLPI